MALEPISDDPTFNVRDASVLTERVLIEESFLLDRINELELEKSKWIGKEASSQDDDGQVLYYTGFKSYSVFKAFLTILVQQ